MWEKLFFSFLLKWKNFINKRWTWRLRGCREINSLKLNCEVIVSEGLRIVLQHRKVWDHLGKWRQKIEFHELFQNSQEKKTQQWRRRKNFFVRIQNKFLRNLTLQWIISLNVASSRLIPNHTTKTKIHDNKLEQFEEKWQQSFYLYSFCGVMQLIWHHVNR